MNIKKLFSCKCGKSSAFEISSELNLEDVTVSATCPSCYAGMHITVSSMLGSQQGAGAQAASEEAAPANTEDEHGIEHAEYASVGDENVEAAVKSLFG